MPSMQFSDFFTKSQQKKNELEGRPVEELVEGGDEKLSDGLEEVEAVVGWVWVGREVHQGRLVLGALGLVPLWSGRP